MKATIKRLGGNPALRAARNDVATAEYARDRAAAELKAQRENLERCEAMLVRARARLAELKGDLN